MKEQQSLEGIVNYELINEVRTFMGAEKLRNSLARYLPKDVEGINHIVSMAFDANGYEKQHQCIQALPDYLADRKNVTEEIDVYGIVSEVRSYFVDRNDSTGITYKSLAESTSYADLMQKAQEIYNVSSATILHFTAQQTKDE